jgi:hypothetical protein
LRGESPTGDNYASKKKTQGSVKENAMPLLLRDFLFCEFLFAH